MFSDTTASNSAAAAATAGVPVFSIGGMHHPHATDVPVPSYSGSIVYEPGLPPPPPPLTYSDPQRYGKTGTAMGPLSSPRRQSTQPGRLPQGQAHLRSPSMGTTTKPSPLSLSSITSPFEPSTTPTRTEALGQSKNWHAQMLKLGERLRGALPLLLPLLAVRSSEEGPAIRTPHVPRRRVYSSRLGRCRPRDLVRLLSDRASYTSPSSSSSTKGLHFIRRHRCLGSFSPRWRRQRSTEESRWLQGDDTASLCPSRLSPLPCLRRRQRWLAREGVTRVLICRERGDAFAWFTFFDRDAHDP
jgi:hypothetical protein